MPGAFSWWFLRGGPPARELGYSGGPWPPDLLPRPVSLPSYLSPVRQVYSSPELLGEQPQVGTTGEGGRQGYASDPGTAPQTAPATQPGSAPSARINISGPVASLLGLAIRAVGLPGPVAALLNFAIGAARRAAPTTTTDPGSTDFPIGVSRGDAGGSSFADVLRSRESPDSLEPPAGPLLPGSVDPPDQDVLIPGNIAPESDLPYGTGQTPSYEGGENYLL